MYDEKLIKKLIDEAKSKGDEEIIRGALNLMTHNMERPVGDCCNIIFGFKAAIKSTMEEINMPKPTNEIITKTLHHQLLIGILGNAMNMLNISKEDVDNMLIDVVNQQKSIDEQQKQDENKRD